MFLFPVFLIVFSICVCAQAPTPDHVVIVIEENHDYSQIIGSEAAPFINSLAADSMGALFTQSSALTRPSQPNYLMLFSGSSQGVANDNLPSGLPFTTVNLGASLIKSGKTFAGYAEELPSVGYSGTSSGAYVRKHNPWVNWQNSPTNGIPSPSNLPLASFPGHFDSLPTVSFVIPSCDNDMHNGTDPATITTGDSWLKDHLKAYILWAKKNNSLFILTYDEGSTSGNSHIATLFVGSMVKPGRYNEPINHFSVLRTIEDMYGLPHAGESSAATAITDCWSAATGVGGKKGSAPPTALPDRRAGTYFGQSTLNVCNLLGRQVARLVQTETRNGDRAVQFVFPGFTAGVYPYRLTARDFAQTGTILAAQ